MNDNGLLEKIEMTVMKDTANGLRKIAKDAGITIGEVVDRLVVQMTPTDPIVAETLLTQELMIIMSKLSQEDSQKVNANFAEAILLSCSPESLDELVAEVRRKKLNVLEQLMSLPDEKRAEVRDVLQQFMKDGLGEQIIK